MKKIGPYRGDYKAREIGSANRATEGRRNEDNLKQSGPLKEIGPYETASG